MTDVTKIKKFKLLPNVIFKYYILTIVMKGIKLLDNCLLKYSNLMFRMSLLLVLIHRLCLNNRTGPKTNCGHVWPGKQTEPAGCVYGWNQAKGCCVWEPANCRPCQAQLRQKRDLEWELEIVALITLKCSSRQVRMYSETHRYTIWDSCWLI